MDRLMEWSQSVGVQVNTSIDLLTKGEYGSQGTATLAIPANSELCSIPFSQCITPELACRTFHLSFVNICRENLETTVLAAYLLHERNAEHSAWTAYIDALPRTLDTPAFWSEEDLAWLKGTNLDGEADIRRLRMNDQIEQLGSMMKLADIGQADEEDWKWAYGIIHSRSFPSFLIYRDANRSASHPILLPVLDTFNHRPGTAITWSPDYDTARLAFLSGPYRAGEQIFNNYGAKSNEEFLMSYGFCLAESIGDHICLKLPGLPDAFYLRDGALVPEYLLSAMAERLTVDITTDHGRVVALDSFERALAQKRLRLLQHRPADPPANHRQSQAALYRDGQLRLLDAGIAQARRLLRDRLDGAVTLERVWSPKRVAQLLPEAGDDLAAIEEGELCGLGLADLLVALLFPPCQSSLKQTILDDQTDDRTDDFWVHFGERIRTSACTPITTQREFGRALASVEAAAWQDEEDGRTYYLGLLPSTEGADVE